MEIWKESQLKQLSHTQEIKTAYRIALNFARNLGYKFCGFSITSNSVGVDSSAVNLNNFPHEWNTQYEKNNATQIDPIVAHCNRSTLPVLWSEELFFQDAMAMALAAATRFAAWLVPGDL